MDLPTTVEYPMIVIGDLHGRVAWLDRLVAKLRQLPEWPGARLVFLGDLVDRCDSVRALVDRVLELLAEKPGSTCVTGNHDMALVGATGLDDRPPRPYWVRRYAAAYDHQNTFRSYLGRVPDRSSDERWVNDLAALNAAIPADHRRFLSGLPWVAEAEGHVFLHNGLSAELDCPASVQLHCLHKKIWEAPGFYATYIGCVSAAAAIVLIPHVPLQLVIISVQVFAGLILPSAIIFLQLLLNDRELLGERWVNRPWNNYINWTIIIVLFALSLLLAAQVMLPNLFQ